MIVRVQLINDEIIEVFIELHWLVNCVEGQYLFVELTLDGVGILLLIAILDVLNYHPHLGVVSDSQDQADDRVSEKCRNCQKLYTICYIFVNIRESQQGCIGLLGCGRIFRANAFGRC